MDAGSIKRGGIGGESLAVALPGGFCLEVAAAGIDSHRLPRALICPLALSNLQGKCGGRNGTGSLSGSRRLIILRRHVREGGRGGERLVDEEVG